MKRLFLIIMIAALALGSCIDQTPEMEAVGNVKITLSYTGDEFLQTTPSVGKEVKLKSALREYKATTDAQGVATFSGVVPDTYNVSSNGVLSADERQRMVDPPATGIKVMTNGSIGGLQIYADLTEEMEMKVGVESNIIISKVYYNGCKDDNNTTYQTDSYIEFYNNSDETVTTENLYFALLDTEGKDPFVGENEENVYGKDVYKIPLMTLEPGRSIVFAREARDHTITAANSVNLTDADFQTEKNAAPGVLILEGDYYIYRTFTIPNLAFVGKGGDGVILFKTADNPRDFEKGLADPTKPATTFQYLKIPANSIIDGVDILPYLSIMNTAKKRLSDKIDATYITLPVEYKGANSGISFDRKVIDVTESGRKVLKDTNNSVEDFVWLKDNKAPRDYDKPELYK